MEFLKKNYEKVLLGLVLLGLVVAVGFLPFMIAGEHERLSRLTNPGGIVPRLPDLDMSRWDAAHERASGHLDVDFSDPHRLFNPMEWQKDKSGRLLRTTQVGPTALVLTNISAYYLTITFDRAVQISDSPPAYGYYISSGTPPAPSRANFYRVGEKNPRYLLTVMQVNGPPDEPTNMVVRLHDTEQPATLARPEGSTTNTAAKLTYKRLEGYAVTFRYPPEGKTFANLRVGGILNFNADRYTIIKISTDEVVLEQASNKKHWTIKKQ